MTRCLLFDTRRSCRRSIAVETPFTRRDTARSLALTSVLDGHSGCINSIEFNESGRLLVTGSDDRTVCLFDTCSWTPRGCLMTSHIRNIFSAAIVPGSGDRTLVSCGLDGRTCVLRVVEGSSTLAETEEVTKKIIHRHSNLCSKILFSPGQPDTVYVGHGSGSIGIIDLRLDREVDSIQLPSGCSSCNTLANSPVHPFVIACGTDKPYVMMIDVRKWSRDNPPFLRFATREAMQSNGIGGLNFNARGNQIIASYKANDVFAYEWVAGLECADRRNVAADELQWYPDKDFGSHPTEVGFKRYRGRQNKLTMFKEAAYYMDDAFVVTGGDCGHVFVWDAHSTRLLKKIKADSDIVNGVLTHPALDCVVACGIDSNAKVIRPCDQRHVEESPKHSFSRPEIRHRFRGRLDGEMASEEDTEDEDDGNELPWSNELVSDSSEEDDADYDDPDAAALRIETRALVSMQIPFLSVPIPEGRDMEDHLKNVVHWLKNGSEIYGSSDADSDDFNHQGDGDEEADGSSEAQREESDGSEEAQGNRPTVHSPRAPDDDDDEEEEESGIEVESATTENEDSDNSDSTDTEWLSDDGMLLKFLGVTQRYVEYAEQLTHAVGRMGLIHVQENRLRVNSVRPASLSQQRQTYWRILKYFATICYFAFDGKGWLARHAATREQWAAALVDATILKASIFAAEGDVDGALATLASSAAQLHQSIRLVMAMICVLSESRTSPALLQLKIEELRAMVRDKFDTTEARSRARRFLTSLTAQESSQQRADSAGATTSD